MHIALACATRRGKLVLEELIGLAPQARLTVFCFKEKPWEPPFVEEIKATALAAGAEFFLTPKLQTPELAALWADSPPDLLLAVSWRYMIPPEIYTRPRLGSFVFHDSMLPANRGFAPSVWAVIKGRSQTGVSLITMAQEVDGGELVDQRPVAIGPEETIGQVMDRVTTAYLELLKANLTGLMAGTTATTPQDETKASANPRWTPELGRIDWTAPASQIYNLIRGVSRPYPGAFTYIKGQKMIIWAAIRPQEAGSHGPAQPGMVTKTRPGGFSVACGLAGRSRLVITDWESTEGSGSPKAVEPVKIGQLLES